GRSADVAFFLYPFPWWSPRGMRLTEASDPSDARLLDEDLLYGRRVNVDVRGVIIVRAERFEPEEVPLDGTDRVVLRPDRAAPWSRCATVLRRAQAAGLAIDFVFAPKDPQILWERLLRVPVAKDGERLHLPEGAAAGEAFRKVLRRLREGATAFSFE
ncbi:MAG: hypothetical protein ACYS99_22655, partial [Planctomycetota bacterium]